MRDTSIVSGLDEETGRVLVEKDDFEEVVELVEEVEGIWDRESLPVSPGEFKRKEYDGFEFEDYLW